MRRRSQHPFRDAVVKQRPSRHRGLEVTVFSPKHGPAFRAYVHTPGWERVLVVSAATSADAAMERAEGSVGRVVGEGPGITVPANRRPLRLQSRDDEEAPT